MENADYMTTHKDYSESVDALERAVAVLKKQAYDRSQSELMQVAQRRWFETVQLIAFNPAQHIAPRRGGRILVVWW